MRRELGIVLEASASDGVKVLLRSGVNPEDIEVGSLIIIESRSGRTFLVLIDDIGYTTEDHEIIKDVEGMELEPGVIRFVRSRLSKSYIKGTIIAYRDGDRVRRGGRVPELGSHAYTPAYEDIQFYYGEADWSIRYPVGYPKVVGEVSYEVPISMEDLFNLNFGVFGKAGTGKTFLSNLLIAYGILYSLGGRGRMNLLVFDMQGEYAFDVLDDRGNPVSSGVGRLFRDVFTIYVLDEEYQNKYSHVNLLRLPLYNLSREELEYIIDPLEPTPGFKNNLSAIEKHIKNALNRFIDRFKEAGFEIGSGHWILGLLIAPYTIERIVNKVKSDQFFIGGSGSVEEFKTVLDEFSSYIREAIKGDSPALLSSYEAGVRRLSTLIDLPISFIDKYNKLIDDIVNNLYLNDGKIIISFGGRWSRNSILYMALANLIASRLKNLIDSRQYERVEEGRKIIILLEEAHRFLGRGVSIYNPFGKLAREYRKFGVTVVPIDQKPSELDPDVSSMLWTKIVFNLSDEKDIMDALIGIDYPSRYKRIIPTLERGEALIYGIGINIPTILKILNYSELTDRLKDEYDKLGGGRLESSDLYGD